MAQYAAMISFQVAAERLEEFETLMLVEAPRTRAFDGCELFEIYRNAEGEVVFLEHWESEEKSKLYGRWRAERGDFETLGAFFTTPPKTSVYRRLDNAISDNLP
ncbi:putative quinol monooxygenase [Phenylobacterium sp.]|uniref:putative quinol monooxygenase n=1 Tax=Phenylobacterium sp. TaxID=1871053 RepID=UPI0027372E0B|nr:antibiotic biosynthesis monooxygenase [Phenylobacterium sp.]MDP3855698.1 antibiotic biosynthesis monooxygenase [Phenylobacterium sp.]